MTLELNLWSQSENNLHLLNDARLDKHMEMDNFKVTKRNRQFIVHGNPCIHTQLRLSAGDIYTIYRPKKTILM